jgi:hypothetical protein
MRAGETHDAESQNARWRRIQFVSIFALQGMAQVGVTFQLRRDSSSKWQIKP